jgi:hypothetical protein
MADEKSKPDVFFSYSTAENTNVLLSVLVWVVFHADYNLRFTPSALTSGQSQLVEIEKQISESAFGIVCLDGLRPNVVHEWGYMRGCDKQVILLKQNAATVDVRHLVRTAVPGLENPQLEMDVHLSNLKDINYAKWFPEDVPKSVKAIWEQFSKIKTAIKEADQRDVKEPHLW